MRCRRGLERVKHVAFANPHAERTCLSWFRTALGLLVDAVLVQMRHPQHSPRYLGLVGAWPMGAVRGWRLAAVPAAGLLPNPLAVHGRGHRRGG